MKIVVLNGSPKGQYSVTLQYVNYIQKKIPQHEIKVLNIAKDIKIIENDNTAFMEIINQVSGADLVLWSFPVYKGLVPSQDMRFIELISERDSKNAFRIKYTAAISTSARTMDHTAHNYVNAVCDDLDMKYISFYSADYDDLRLEPERKRLIQWAENIFESVENKYITTKKYAPLVYNSIEYVPGRLPEKIDIGNNKIIVITDTEDENTNLGRMIKRFKDLFNGDIDIINLNHIDIKGGCMGCMHCWYDNICFYRDGFVEFFDKKVWPANIIVYAESIKGRCYSAKIKQFLDRAYYNHHRPFLKGKQIAEIASGPMSQLLSVREVFSGGAEYMEANYAGCVSDEYAASAEIDAQLYGLAGRLIRFADRQYTGPITFLGLGIHKIIRDLTWGKLRFILPDDHMYHKKNKRYDFPQKDAKSILLNLIMIPLTKIPSVRKEFTKGMNDAIIKPYQKIIRKY